jgi:hypothetical protein
LETLLLAEESRAVCSFKEERRKNNKHEKKESTGSKA